MCPHAILKYVIRESGKYIYTRLKQRRCSLGVRILVDPRIDLQEYILAVAFRFAVPPIKQPCIFHVYLRFSLSS